MPGTGAPFLPRTEGEGALHVAIIGNGIAGVTAARTVRRLQPDWRITVVSGESTYHYSRPALMYVFMGHMGYKQTKPYEDSYWREQRIDLVRGWVTGVDVEGRRLTLHRGEPIEYDRLLIATGSKSNKFGWKGQDLAGVQGLYSLMDLKTLYASAEGCRRAVIVGGGLIGVELAEMLHSRGIHVTFLVREEAYWSNVLPLEEARLVGRVIEAEGIDLRLETNLDEIVDDGRGQACAVITKETGERIDCQIVGLTPGVSPNVEVVKDTPIETGKGVLVDQGLRTSIDGVFAAGDCAEILRPDEERNLIQAVWYTGEMQGEVAGANIAGEDRRYDPGIWYNSAKFMDLEYQVYGRVNAGINADVPGEKNLYWEHSSGRHALRIAYTEDGVIGFNLMGLRYRHRVCERWIAEERPIEYVLEHLAEANFDTELFRRHEPEITRAFREQLA